MARTLSASFAALAVATVLALGACDSGEPSPSASATPSPTAASPSPSPSPSPEPPPVPLSELRISLDVWASGFTRPVFVASRPGDDRVYVVEQSGRIFSLTHDAKETTLVLDIRGVVNDASSEQGLLGVAFHPDDPSRMFLHYTGAQGQNLLVEHSFPLTSATASPQMTQALLTQTQPHANHNGGMIAFGPDGMLYVSIGDGGGRGDPSGHGQNPATLLGTLVRLNVDQASGYTVPDDNPFAAGGAGAPEVWAYGLRNPWRFSFDGDTLYVADVGQNLIEELNVVDAAESAGANFGWNLLEGSLCFPSGKACDGEALGMVDPVYEYQHASGRCSITGGYVYRGQTYPSLRGVYFFGDYCTGEIFGLRAPEGAAVEARILLDASIRVSSFGVGSDGQIYVLDLESGSIFTLAQA